MPLILSQREPSSTEGKANIANGSRFMGGRGMHDVREDSLYYVVQKNHFHARVFAKSSRPHRKDTAVFSSSAALYPSLPPMADAMPCIHGRGNDVKDPFPLFFNNSSSIKVLCFRMKILYELDALPLQGQPYRRVSSIPFGL